MSINLGVCGRHQAEEENLRKICERFRDWESAKRHVYPILLPKERKSSKLEELVWIEKLDLAVAFGFRCYDIFGNVGCIKVKKEMLDVWYVSVGELYRAALNNMQNDGYKIRNTLDMLGEAGITENLSEEEIMQVKLYTLTNKDAYYGAAGIIYNDFLSSNINEDCYIFPSSVDEIFIYPLKPYDNIKVELLYRIIEHVNTYYVSDGSFLSNSLYFYDSKTGEVSIVERNG